MLGNTHMAKHILCFQDVPRLCVDAQMVEARIDAIRVGHLQLEWESRSGMVVTIMGIS